MNKTVKIKLTRSEIETAYKICKKLDKDKKDFCSKCIIAHLLNKKLENSKIIEAGFAQFDSLKFAFNVIENQKHISLEITFNFDSCVLNPDRYSLEKFIEKYENTELEFIQTDRTN